MQRRLLKTVCNGSLGIARVFRELPTPQSSSSDHHHLTVEILVTLRYPPCTCSHSFLFVCLFAGILLDLSDCVYYCSFLLYLLVNPSSLPPRLLQLNKQTNPLPLDTELGRGDLLCLSGRILTDIVAPVNKRKALEAIET